MMKKILITGGTVFVSKYVATYFLKRNYEVFVLNRGTRPQVQGVRHIPADRNHPGDCLKEYSFDAIMDICGYNKPDIEHLLDAVGEYGDYVFISSSAVYPETNPQPFSEEQPIGTNKVWGRYGSDKAEAEQYLLSRDPEAYIIRPPYLYGPMQNLYREPFVFDCAMEGRSFYIPRDGKMKLQFFHVDDLCKVMEQILLRHPKEHIYNVGNERAVEINEFVELCYKAVGVPLKKVYVTGHDNQRDYFSFYDYEYTLDISRQKQLLQETKDLYEGLKESFAWYRENPEQVVKKPYVEFIQNHLLPGVNT